ncbi:MAG TPA: 6-phosphogluconolactonase [Tepidisphaeraceae bacterium]|jgi:6-phosphogluconolactonase
MTSSEIKVVADHAALVEEAADQIATAARIALADHQWFSIALSGGSTPEPVYSRLTEEPYNTAIDWSRVRIYFGDERCVPPDSPQSNYRMANEAMLSKLPISAENIFRMRGEIDPNQAAMEYGRLLKEHFGDTGGVDLNLLGMGDDGHTASLFPNSEALKETRHRCVAHLVTKLNAWRITMTAPFINRSDAVIFLVSGADKAARVREVREGPHDPQRLPSQLIHPVNGRLLWLLDSAAAGIG